MLMAPEDQERVMRKAVSRHCPTDGLGWTWVEYMSIEELGAVWLSLPVTDRVAAVEAEK